MPATCLHGYPPSECLICGTLGGGEGAEAALEAGPARRGIPEPREVPRPARRHSPGGMLGIALVSLLAIGAAAWILIGIVFTALHLLELIVVAAGAGWVGYKIGQFRGSRHPRSR